MRRGGLWRAEAALWDAHRQELEGRLSTLEMQLRAAGARVISGGPHTRWDLELRPGSFGAARLLMAVEEHPGAHQLVRVRWWPILPLAGAVVVGFCGALGVTAVVDRAWGVAAILGCTTLLAAGRVVLECGAATDMIRETVARPRAGGG